MGRDVEAMGPGNDVVTGLMINPGVCLFHLMFSFLFRCYYYYWCRFVVLLQFNSLSIIASCMLLKLYCLSDCLFSGQFTPDIPYVGTADPAIANRPSRQLKALYWVA